jgi:hypothetical protein
MSKVKDLQAEIMDRLEDGEHAWDIATELGIPVSWVQEAQEIANEFLVKIEDFSPYATSNS